MISHPRRKPRPVQVLAGACLLVSLLAAVPAAAQLEPFPCTGEAFIVQREQAQLFQIDQTLTPFIFQPVGPNADLSCDPLEACNLTDAMGNPIEANNLSFRTTDGLLYAVELTALSNNGLIRIDRNGDVEFLGVPTGGGFPTTRTDAGDVSLDGTTMYVNQAGTGTLAVVRLTTSPPSMISTLSITGASGRVNDWAYNPIDGNLYGGDRDDRQIGRLNIVSAMGGTVGRQDFTPAGCAPVTADCDAMELPTDAAFGGAWFNASGRLFIYQNGISGNADDFDGKLFEIDIDLTIPASPTAQIVRTQLGRDSEGRNDGAACIQTPPFVGAAKEMTATMPGPPSTVTIQYAFENFGTSSPADDMTAFSATDNLVAVFGTPITDWTLTSITSSTGTFHNPAFDGAGDPELINQAPSQGLTAGQVVTITVVVQLLTTDGGVETPPASGTFEFCNQVVVEALNSSGALIGDISVGGTDSDPDMNDIPDESGPSCFQLTPPPPDNPSIQLIKTGVLDAGGDGMVDVGDMINYTFQVTNTGNVPLTDVSVTDPMVSPITCPSGNPIPLLNPMESETCTGSYSIVQADIDAGEKCNTATATGTPPTGPPVTDDDEHCEPITTQGIPTLGQFGLILLALGIAAAGAVRLRRQS